MAKHKSSRRVSRRGPAPKWIGDVPREPNGRISRRAKAARQKMINKEREETEMQILSTAISARVRHGVSEKWARDQRSGTLHGRMYQAYLDNPDGAGAACLSFDQYEAAEWFLQRLNDYRAALGSPAHVYDREPGLSASSDPEEAYQTFCNAARSRWRQIETTLQDATTRARGRVNLLAALEIILVRQQPMPHLVAELKIALDLLHLLKVGRERGGR